jgi:hypothetical protein
MLDVPQNSHLDLFSDNLGAIIDEHGEMFYQDIRVMKQCCQGRWDPAMMVTTVGFCNGRVKPFIRRKNNIMCIEF